MKLTPDKKEGGFVVTCRDLPEAITEGENVEEAPNEAASHPPSNGNTMSTPKPSSTHQQ
jgi:hypothetical protein